MENKFLEQKEMGDCILKTDTEKDLVETTN